MTLQAPREGCRKYHFSFPLLFFILFCLWEMVNYHFDDDVHVILFHCARGTTAPRSLPLCVNKLHVHIFKRQISGGISMDTWVVQ